MPSALGKTDNLLTESIRLKISLSYFETNLTSQLKHNYYVTQLWVGPYIRLSNMFK